MYGWCSRILPVVILAGTVYANKPAEHDAPDLTKVPIEDASRSYHLGPTGARGWMHVVEGRTTPQDLSATYSTDLARQILVTEVETGSPADGVLAPGDVILGTGGKRFEMDARRALADAIDEAEKTENKGELKLLRWRPTGPDPTNATTRATGKAEAVTLKLKVLGDYSDTAPYDCAKSAAILDQTVEAMCRNGVAGKLDLPALSLLATGEAKHLEMVKTYVRGIAGPNLKLGVDSLNNGHAWNWGYRTVLLSEYFMLTGDESVRDAIREHTVALARGQAIGGIWGHRMAQPNQNNGRLHGRLTGYAALNQPSVICFMALIMGRMCGVDHPEVDLAIERSNQFFAYFADKGAVPYGDHEPQEYLLSNNGLCASAAISFALQGNAKAARFYSRLCAAASGRLEIGHTGPFFATMWTGLGANLCGPDATAAFFKQWRWLRTLARKWDGGFVYQSPEGGKNSYRGLDANAAMVLNYCLPRRVLLITGREPDKSIWVGPGDVAKIVNVRDIDYERAADSELLEMLGHDIPVVRRRAAEALAHRDGEFTKPLKAMLAGARNQKIGACHAVAALAERARPLMDDVMDRVRNRDEDLWIRCMAANALRSLGDPARPLIPELTQLIVDREPGDPRRKLDRYLAATITALAPNPQELQLDHKLYYLAAMKMLDHPHAIGRYHGMRMIHDIPLEDFHIFADKIVHVIRNNDPAYTTYHIDRPRSLGLSILDRLNIQEGLELTIETIEPDVWGQKYRIGGRYGRLEQLKKYGANAKPYLPQLEAMKLNPQDKADTMAAIENSTMNRRLLTLEQAKHFRHPAEP